MSRVESEETLRCDKEGYFDLDSLKPYSSVWVSTCRRDIRPKRDHLDGEGESIKYIAPSRACNNLHNLLETGEGPQISPNEDPVKHQRVDSGFRGDELFSPNTGFLPNTIKLDKGEGASLKMKPDKTIESMFRSEFEYETKHDVDSVKGNSKQRKVIPLSKDKLYDTLEQTKEELPRRVDTKTEWTFNGDEVDVKGNTTSKHQDKTDDKKEINADPISYLSCVENLDEKGNNYKLLSAENGKLISELGLTSLNVKDQSGREYPIHVKYVWETDTSEVVSAAENVLNASQKFINLIESVSSVGFKREHSPATAKKANKKEENTLKINVPNISKDSPPRSEDRNHHSEETEEQIIEERERTQNPLFLDEKRNKWKDTKYSYRQSKNSFKTACQNRLEMLSECCNENSRSNVKVCTSKKSINTFGDVAQKMKQAPFDILQQKDKGGVEKKIGLAPIKLKTQPLNREPCQLSRLSRPTTFNKTFYKKDTIQKPVQRPPSVPNNDNLSSFKCPPDQVLQDPSLSTKKKPYGNKFQTQPSQVGPKNAWR